MNYMVKFRNTVFDNGKAELSFCRKTGYKNHVEPSTRVYKKDGAFTYNGGAPQFEFRDAADVEEILQWSGTE